MRYVERKEEKWFLL